MPPSMFPKTNFEIKMRLYKIICANSSIASYLINNKDCTYWYTPLNVSNL